jgi:hypothetical protein
MLHGKANDGISFANVDVELDNIDESGPKIALTIEVSGHKKQECRKQEG